MLIDKHLLQQTLPLAEQLIDNLENDTDFQYLDPEEASFILFVMLSRHATSNKVSSIFMEMQDPDGEVRAYRFKVDTPAETPGALQ